MKVRDKEVEDEKVGLKSKEGEEVTGLGPQHAELLVRLHKLCSEEMTSQMILKLCSLKEEQRMAIGQSLPSSQKHIFGWGEIMSPRGHGMHRSPKDHSHAT